MFFAIVISTHDMFMKRKDLLKIEKMNEREEQGTGMRR